MSREIEPGCLALIVGVSNKCNEDMIGRPVVVKRPSRLRPGRWVTSIHPHVKDGIVFACISGKNLLRIDGHTEDEREEEGVVG